MEENSAEMVASPPGPGAGKSKLDTLSKEDLIKFAKKQMAVMQKVKSRCTDLEKEVDVLKAKSNSSTDDTVIQELTERMDAVLLEKAETQQSLVLLRKDNEKAKQQAQDALEKAARLQEELDQINAEHMKEMENLKQTINISHAKHKEEVERLVKLLKETEESKQIEELQQQEADRSLKAELERVRQSYEDKLSGLQQQLEVTSEERGAEMEQLKEDHQAALSESQKEVERLREDLLRMGKAHEEEVRELTEQLEASAADFEMERERLLLLQDELTEQLAQKDSYLHDVQEEEEEPGKTGEQEAGRTPSVSEASGRDDGDDEAGRLRLALEDLQSQHTMLQEELTYLNNVKTELESELQQAREEFQLEKEELEFKINELQMCKEDGDTAETKGSEMIQACGNCETAFSQHEEEIKTLKELHKAEVAELEKELLARADKEKEKMVHEVEELKERCDRLSVERNSAIGEYEATKEILRNLELELGEKTGDFVKQYNAMKEQGALAIQELQQKLKAVHSERDRLLEQIRGLELVLEESQQKEKAVEDLEGSLGALRKKNGDILSLLQQKESAVLELEERLTALSSDKQTVQSLLENAKEEITRIREECTTEQEKTSALELSLRGLTQSNAELHQKLEVSEASLADALAERERIEQQAAALESRLSEAAAEKEQQSSELTALNEEVTELRKKEQLLQEDIKHLRSEDLKSSSEEMVELSKQLQSVSGERDALKTAIEAKQGQLCEVRRCVLELLDQRDGEGETSDIPALVESLLAKVLQEKQELLLQGEERAAQLTEEVERVKDQSDQREAELQARVEELGQERGLLKASLDEVLADTEALQRDLAEMKNANEKIRTENQELLAQIAEAAEKLRAKENEGLSEMGDKASDESTGEVEDLRQLLEEKESLLSKLQEDIALLQKTKDESAATEDSSVTELTEKIGVLQKENKEKEEKMNKIKAVAVKAKKELDVSRKEVQSLKEEVEALKEERDRVSSSVKDIIHGAEGYKNLLADYDRQTEQLDKERERAEGAERQIGDLTKRLQAAVLQHEQLTSEREDLMARLETLQSNVRHLEAQALEMQKLKSVLEKDLEGERLLKEQKIKDHSAAVREVEELQAQLRKQKQQLQQTAQELEQLRKDAQQSTLMDMEMADYERLVKELNQKLVDKESRIEELGAEIQTQKKKEEALQEEIVSLKSLVSQGEEKASKMKQLLVKTKKDLADAKKQEAAQMVLQASLKGELEAHQQQVEDYKIQCCDLTAERHRLQEQLRAVTEQQQRAATSFQHRLTALQEERNTAKAELASTTSEFESYKVRVHNVLKQKKNKSAAQNDSDVSKQEREHMEGLVEQLRGRLQDTQQSLQTSCAELQQLQAEHDTLLERHNKILQETVVKEAELRERLITLQSENMALKSEHAQTVSQLTAQADALRGSFREQVRHLQDEHRNTVETLQQQMSRLEAQLFQMQRETSVTSAAPAQQVRKTPQERKPTELPLFDLQSMAREEGEGMETTETESVSSAGTPLPSLEQLLTSPDPKQEPFVWQVEPTKEELIQKLSTATRSMEHMNGLLHETEATNAILMEQITLLKSEMRRLERNQEREKSVANLEYLKNVLLQFIFLKSGSERQALLPVIHTMLQLSPEEKSKLAAIAQGDEEVAAGSRASGWTSYLHSWSGIR
ncbi:GRIP and coiled-coil domain-containing protein 2 isoform X1 [Megalops cyprinoides]|uniref:GRIP and coiled-coil domain-containing protein 2 isoform X1 n=1 Tax=Megalops cyprinoides TaxID=118141 RepID=UPI001863FCA5|nr:GRIP and coiled-coil domain-containing protein 2 isoform X1 [Megalops cyprinoides]